MWKNELWIQKKAPKILEMQERSKPQDADEGKEELDKKYCDQSWGSVKVYSMS